ncbi:MAG: transketolase [Paracoccus sp. (in: a-proteobacteria)]|uniref:transketolase n=1 Tax=Paracoccus sp. TaxID=267 RepID=UPI000C6203C2|nr:transketolase [Paracoccus sp. (in: a-proteobacteria)]MBA48956.1 transketolase [Paracoccus sp. (in: a-proteobacteria)]|tara:strand:+ start:3348 stop:5372 length:2025 start_codon:yes stop_codon:yes gene_type:complete
MDIEARREADPQHWKLASAIRVLAMDAVEAASSGHPGMPMGMADVATVLFRKHLTFDASDPHWFDRDRFVLSAGHGSMLLYALLHLTGYADMTMDQIRNFRQLGSITAGHPEYGHATGIETTTGPLGQGLATAVGMAMAEEAMRAEFGAELCDHRTWVIAGDGCLMEGISQEAVALAGAQRLGRLVVLWDNNDITIDGRVSLSDRTDQRARFEASGWRVLSCDGHDVADIERALSKAATDDGRPVLVDCKTIIGFGAPNKSDSAKAHGSPLGAEEIEAVRRALGWTAPAFEIPDDILSDWREIGARGGKARKAWEDRVEALASDNREEFRRRTGNGANPHLVPTIVALKTQAAESKPKIATRKASENVLEVLNPHMPENFGGSADLTGSNNTRTPDLGIFGPEDRMGRYIHYGIREHGMAAAMNGIWLHGGFRPYGGTFLTFTDYARGAIRLSALMGLPVIYVMTHDSIGLGEDGPTHQPVEHLAIARATPNILTLRPCDQVETAEAWELALTQTARPTIMALSRQGLQALRTSHQDENLSARGAYVLREASGGKPAVVLMASGSEVEIAATARDTLEAEGTPARVVSVPSMELFRDQPSAYREEVLPAGTVRVAIEAAVRQPWDWLLLGERGREEKSDFVGMTGFGASGPAPALYKEFGITADNVVARVKAML